MASYGKVSSCQQLERSLADMHIQTPATTFESDDGVAGAIKPLAIIVLAQSSLATTTSVAPLATRNFINLHHDVFCKVVQTLDFESLKNLSDTCQSVAVKLKMIAEQLSPRSEECNKTWSPPHNFVFSKIRAKTPDSLSKFVGELDLRKLINLSLEDLESLIHFFPNVTKLKLSQIHNQRILEAVSCLIQLKYLDLSGFYKMTDLKFMCFSKLINLNYLSLKACHQITDAGIMHLVNFTQLKYLNLSCCCEIGDASLLHLSNITTLEYLHLYHCHKITDTGVIHLKNLMKLKHLNLEDCSKITDASLLYLSNITTLEYLNLFSCHQITDTGVIHLKNLMKLKHLNLGLDNQITDDSLLYLSDITTLEYLELTLCRKISNIGIKHLINLKNLKKLIIAHCHQITDDSLICLSNLTNLECLNINYCPQITNYAVAQLQEKIPRITIIKF